MPTPGTMPNITRSVELYLSHFDDVLGGSKDSVEFMDRCLELICLENNSRLPIEFKPNENMHHEAGINKQWIRKTWTDTIPE